MINSLTSFRFITALVVFLFHCQIHLGWHLGVKFLDKFISNGATFMTGFFVLSGFIMALVYDKTDFSRRENILGYYKKRFAKIYPTYIIATLVYFVLFRDFSTIQYARVFINDTLLVQGFFPSMFPIGLNGGTWSLSVEMFLYFLFPFLILLSGKSKKILIAGLLLVLVVSFNSKYDNLYSLPIYRLGDFLIGMGFYFLKDYRKYFNVYTHVACIALLAIVCKKMGGNSYVGGQFLIAPLFGFWVTSVYFSSSKFYDNKVFVYLGLISYSFYLWQFAALEFGKKFITAYPDISVSVVVVLTLLVNILLSAISYSLLEEKVRKYILNKY